MLSRSIVAALVLCAAQAVVGDDPLTFQLKGSSSTGAKTGVVCVTVAQGADVEGLRQWCEKGSSCTVGGSVPDDCAADSDISTCGTVTGTDDMGLALAAIDQSSGQLSKLCVEQTVEATKVVQNLERALQRSSFNDYSLSVAVSQGSFEPLGDGTVIPGIRAWLSLGFLDGVMVGAIWLAITLCGLCSLLNIQTPRKFDTIKDKQA
eukprot:CAMPEP_0170745490 /NCGR_PEP_ID=MMETSP0437-20130122/8320_1 /TAXON_ID=0 /ORGANISM="Sexangularia sp." /LENGTH=205 /DNA_ID=CAMNT_0011084211 /DNA_START=29 /DNA_END=646 /DNA_ORIENTATION=+